MDHIFTRTRPHQRPLRAPRFPHLQYARLSTNPPPIPTPTQLGRRAHSLLFNETHTFSPAVLNDFRFNWQPRSNHPTTLSIDQGWPAKLGLKGVSDRAFPRVNTASYAAMGSTQQERVQMPIHDTHMVDQLSMLPWQRIRSSSAAKSGSPATSTTLTRSCPASSPSASSRPSNPAASANTGNALASLCSASPIRPTCSDSDLLDRRAKYFALFLQDDWKVTRT